MQKSFFDKNQSKIVKGYAIVFMYWSHLFNHSERLREGNYWTPILGNIGGVATEVMLSTMFAISVPLFLFMAGYAFLISFNKCKGSDEERKILIKRVTGLYRKYWIVFIIFIPICTAYGKIELHLDEFILNFVGAVSTYCGEWWFFSLYIELFVCAYILRKVLCNKKYTKWIIVVSAVLMFGGYGGKLIFQKILFLGGFSKSWLWNELYIFLIKQPIFVEGLLIAQYSGFDKLDNRLRNSCTGCKQEKKTPIYAYILVLLFWILVYLPIPDTFILVIITPCIISGLSGITQHSHVWFKKVFYILGDNSTYMWLVHSLLLYKLMQSVIYYFHYSILCYLMLIVVSLVAAIILKYIEKVLFTITNHRKSLKV